jgi:N-acetylneuraminic acid mutarotase
MEDQKPATPNNTAASPSKKPRRWLVVFLGLVLILGVSFFVAWWREDSTEDAEVTATTFVADKWRTSEQKAEVARTEVAAAMYKDKVFVIGGINAANQPVNTVERFDTTGESWGPGPDLPTAVHHTSAVAFDGKLYVIGGLTGTEFIPTAKVYVYDGIIWTEGPSLPEAIGAAGVAVVKDRIYIVGGHDSKNQSSNRMYSLGEGDTTWKTEPPMTTMRNHLAVATVAGKLYAIAGRNDDSVTLTKVEVYDPLNETWKAAPDLPTGRSGITAAVLKGKIYVFGGESTEKTFDENEVFDPKTQKWAASIPMPEARHGLGSAVSGKTIYIFLGGPQPGYSTSGTVQILEFKAE